MTARDRPGSPELVVLGSGGPMHGGGRGSAAYLLLLDGHPPLVIDMGGDTPHALARAGIGPGKVGLLLISHLHPDHVSGIPDFIWGELTAGRSAPLTVIGPPAGEGFPDMQTFWDRQFGKTGAFPFLAGDLAQAGFPLLVTTSDRRRIPLGADEGAAVSVYPVRHGRAPTTAFRIDAGGHSLVLAGDQVMRDPAFVDFARDADLMVAHLVVNGTAANTALAQVVALPEDIGRTASQAGVRSLLLSHLMLGPEEAADAASWSLAALGEALADIKARYRGPVTVAEDLARYRIGSPGHQGIEGSGREL